MTGAVLTLAVLAFGPVLSVPFQAFLDFCFGEATDDTEMSAGLLMWFSMQPEWSAMTLGIGLVAIGMLIKSIIADKPDPTNPAVAVQPVPAEPGTGIAPHSVEGLSANTLYAAMIWAAEATGGMTADQLADMFEDLTCMEAPEWGRKYALKEQTRPHPAMVVILDKVQEKKDQKIIILLVLVVCMTRPKLTRQATQLVWLLAAKFRMTKAEVKDLYLAIRSDKTIAFAA